MKKEIKEKIYALLDANQYELAKQLLTGLGYPRYLSVKELEFILDLDILETVVMVRAINGINTLDGLNKVCSVRIDTSPELYICIAEVKINARLQVNIGYTNLDSKTLLAYFVSDCHRFLSKNQQKILNLVFRFPQY